MSLILEALKKSEAERRLGQAPGLLSPTLPAPPTRRRRGVALAAVAVVAVVLAAAGGWWFAQRAAPPADPAPPLAGSGPQTAAVALDPPPAGGALPLPPAAGGSQTQPAAATRAPEPVALSAAPAPAEDVARRPAPPPRQAASTAPPPAPALPEDPTFASIEREARALVAGDSLPAAPVAARSTAAVTAPTHAAPPGPSQSAPPAAATAATPQPLEQLPGLRQLPDDVRAALPPLKLSMHVFAEAPDERFVLIDGRRYGEGAAVGEGLLVEEIRRDGVVMVRNGTRFLLRRPG